MELSSLQSVKAAAAHFKQAYSKLNILINNAGLAKRGTCTYVSTECFGPMHPPSTAAYCMRVARCLSTDVMLAKCIWQPQRTPPVHSTIAHRIHDGANLRQP